MRQTFPWDFATNDGFEGPAHAIGRTHPTSLSAWMPEVGLPSKGA
jgi:hypothetical protein